MAFTQSHARLTWGGSSCNGTEQWSSGLPEQAGSTSLNHPPQVSLAVTLETGITRGRAARGRIYLPTTGQSVAADGRISSTNATDLAVRTATFLDDLTDLMAAPVWVMSDVGAGTSRPVEAVSVGRVFDTQRRRRRQLDEDRVSALINP